VLTQSFLPLVPLLPTRHSSLLSSLILLVDSAKALFSVGGFEGGRYFSNLMASAGNRAAFAKKIEAMRKHLGGYDGVLLDWDAPGVDSTGCNTVRQTDAAHLKLFLTELRSVLGSAKLIAVAVAPTGLVGEAEKVLSTGMASFFSEADYVILNTADASGEWSVKTGPAAPLRSCGSASSFTSAAEFYVRAGLPKRKLLLTIPAEAISFTTKSSSLATTIYGSYSSQIYQGKSSTVPKGDASDEGLAYTNVCGAKSSGYSGIFGGLAELAKEGLVSSTGSKGAGGYGYHWDECTETPFLFRPSTKHLIAFENARSVEAKAKYVTDHGLGGVVISDTSGLPNALYKDITAQLSESPVASPPPPPPPPPLRTPRADLPPSSADNTKLG